MSQQLPDFSQLRIMVIGDVMIDRYLNGKVERISPEAPVPVVRLLEEENRLGGAANVALNLRALGAEPVLLSVVGDDANGRLFIDIMNRHDMSTTGILLSEARQTTVKTRVVAQHQQLLRADREDTFSLTEAELIATTSNFEEIISEEKIDLVILQDYNKGVLSMANVEAVLQKCAASEIPVVVDPKKKHFWSYKGVTLFKPNLREIQEQVDFTIKPTKESLDQAAEIIQTKLNHQSTMITLAEHGVYINDGTKSAIYPTQARQIRDVSGAGDSVISVAAAGLAAGMPLTQLAILANLAGGQVIEKPGVVAVDLEQLKQEFVKYSE